MRLRRNPNAIPRLQEHPLVINEPHEIKEETGLEVKVIAPAYVYDEVQEEKHLVLIKFACEQPVGEIQLSEEHDLFLWVPVEELETSPFPDWMKEEIRRAYQVYNELRN